MTVRYSAQSDGGEGLTNQITKTVLTNNLVEFSLYFRCDIYYYQNFILLFWACSPANALFNLFF